MTNIDIKNVQQDLTSAFANLNPEVKTGIEGLVNQLPQEVKADLNVKNIASIVQENPDHEIVKQIVAVFEEQAKELMTQENYDRAKAALDKYKSNELVKPLIENLESRFIAAAINLNTKEHNLKSFIENADQNRLKAALLGYLYLVKQQSVSESIDLSVQVGQLFLQATSGDMEPAKFVDDLYSVTKASQDLDLSKADLKSLVGDVVNSVIRRMDVEYLKSLLDSHQTQLKALISKLTGSLSELTNEKFFESFGKVLKAALLVKGNVISIDDFISETEKIIDGAKTKRPESTSTPEPTPEPTPTSSSFRVGVSSFILLATVGASFLFSA